MAVFLRHQEIDGTVGGFLNVAIPIPVVMANTYVYVQGKGSSGNSRERILLCELTSTTNVSVRRSSTGTDTDFRLHVVEFSSGVTVQRGVTDDVDSTGITETLTSIDTSKSFVLLTVRSGGGSSSFGGEDIVTGDILSSTQLELKSNIAGLVPETSWQVVTWDTASVQKITKNVIADGEITTLPTIVDMSQTFLTVTGRTSTASNPSLTAVTLRDSETVLYKRGTGSTPYDFIIYVVTTPDVHVLRGIETANTAALNSTLIPELEGGVDTNSWPWVTGCSQMFAAAGNGSPGSGQTLVSPILGYALSGTRLDTDTTSTNLDIPWESIEMGRTRVDRVERRYTGQIDMVQGVDVTVNKTIPSVDLSRTMTVITVSTDAGSNSTRFWIIGHTLTSSTNLLIARVSSSDDALVKWTVLEFSTESGITVQRGVNTHQLGSENEDVTISSVDLTESFPFVNSTIDQNSYGHDDAVTAEIINATTLRMQMFRPGGPDGLTNDYYWQVVSVPGATVQKVVVTDTMLATVNTAITAVDLDVTFLVASGTTSRTGDLEGNNFYRHLLTSTTNLRSLGNGVGINQNFVVYIVEDPLSIVGAVAATLPNSTGRLSISYGKGLDVNRTGLWSATELQYLGTLDVVSTRRRKMSVRIEHEDTETALISRDNSEDSLSLSVQVVDWGFGEAVVDLVRPDLRGGLKGNLLGGFQ